MGCDISGEQLWSMIDRDAPELEEHLAICPICRKEAARLREKIGILTEDPNYEVPVPEKLGSYKVLRVLGEGGQAIVYEAEQLSPNRRVAVKVLKGGYLVGKTRLRHFQRETRTLARLNHPYIATIYEAGRTETGLYYFAMELVDGVPLHEYVKNQKPSRNELLDLMGKVCRAIEYAHKQGVIHRDLKPSNIMVDAGGEPKILDFGLARLTRGDDGIDVTTTRDGRIEGTPRYMSPEQAIGLQSTIDARSDVYALGILLYEILTGTPPNRLTTISPDTIRTICEELPRRPSDIERSLGGDIDAILLKALEKKPEDRYQTVADLEQDISQYLGGDPISAKSPSKFYYIKRQIVKRRAVGWIGVAAVCILAGVFWFLQRAPFDERKARYEALDIRFSLLRDGPDDLVYHRAREAMRKYPSILDIDLVWIQVRSRRGEQNNAIGRLVKGLEEDPTLWSFKLLLRDIRVRDALGSDDGSENTYWSETLAASAEAWYLRSFATLNPENALEWAKEAVSRAPENELYLMNLTYVNEISGGIEAALEAARDLVTHGYNSGYWIRYRAMLFCRLGRCVDALEESQRLLEAGYQGHASYSLRAKVQRRLKNYEAAVSDFSIAIDKYGKDNPAAAWHFYHRGTVRWLVGDREGAIADYKVAHTRLTYATYVNARLFIFLHEMGRPDDAKAALAEARRSAKVEPWIQSILACLGGYLSRDELVRIAETSGDPVHVCEAYYYAGEATLLNGAAGDSREWFEKCLGTGVTYEAGDYVGSISEVELAEWRLEQFRSAQLQDKK